MNRGAAMRRAERLVAGLALLAALIVHLGGPDDLWDHAQPRTIAYAVDVAGGGPRAWVLPHDAAGLPATKPPLHAWLAAPVVAITGPASRIAHLAPDLAALVAVWAALLVAGRRWWPRAAHDVGAIAATIWVTALPATKVAFLARPDMLLTAAVVAGWIVVTDLAVRATAGGAGAASGRAAPAPGRPSRADPVPLAHRMILAAAVAGGALAKGPAIAPLLVAAPLILALSGPAARRCLPALLRPGWIAAAILPPALWLAAATEVDPAWIRGEFLGREIAARVTGELHDAGGEGPIRILTSAGHLPAYLGLRFLPWTVPLLLAAVLVVRPNLAVRPVARRPADRVVPRAALILVVVTVAVFSAAAGKRADYLAPCLPAAALAAAWWLARGDRRLAARRAWAVPAAAAALVAIEAVHLRRPSNGVPAAAGEAIARLVEVAGEGGPDAPPLALLGGADSGLATRLGFRRAPDPARHGDLVAAGERHRLVHLSLGPAPIDLAAWVRARPGVAEARILHQASGQTPINGWATWLIDVLPAPPGTGPRIPAAPEE